MGLGMTTPVDHFSGGQSLYRVYDMSGNVWEWCLNERDELTLGSVALESDESRALRGGSWNDDADEARVTFRRAWMPPYERSRRFGFRVATDAER